MNAVLHYIYLPHNITHPSHTLTWHYKLTTVHLTATCIQDNPYLPCSTAIKLKQHNAHSNIPHRLTTLHPIHTFCIQNGPYLPCSVATKWQPSTTKPIHYAQQHMYYTPTPQPSMYKTTLFYTQLTSTNTVGKMAQDVGMV